MVSGKKFVVDFRIFPKVGEKRLPVGIAMRQNLKFGKIVCDFGDGSLRKVNRLVINHVYQKVGTFSGKVEVFEKKYIAAQRSKTNQPTIFLPQRNDLPLAQSYPKMGRGGRGPFGSQEVAAPRFLPLPIRMRLTPSAGAVVTIGSKGITG